MRGKSISLYNALTFIDNSTYVRRVKGKIIIKLVYNIIRIVTIQLVFHVCLFAVTS